MINEYSKFIFVGGLHRSGTTLLYKCIGNHPQISIFSKTGALMNEGQYLQSIYPTANQYGGPGKFGFKKHSFLTEDSPLSNQNNAKTMLSEWSNYWDISKSYFAEKSPPNIIRMRFLQSLFPNAYFIIICRHPIATSFAIQKWVKPPLRKWLDRKLDSLIKHWLICHEQMLFDSIHINNLLLIRYEDFIMSPQSIINKIYTYLNIEEIPLFDNIKTDLNNQYIKKYQKLEQNGLFGYLYTKYIYNCYETKINKFGYSLKDKPYILPAPENFIRTSNN